MSSPLIRAGLGAVALTALIGLTACGGDDDAATVTTISIRPSSYEVKPPATTTTIVTVAAPDADGRSAAEQVYTVASDNDVPFNIAAKFDIPLDELRNYNGWDEDYSGWPGVGGTVRIPPGAKFIDPTATTTTVADDPDTSDGTATEGSTAEAGGDRCNPTYTVEAGDAPLVVTRKFDITIEQLDAANVGVTPDWPNLYTGRDIRLPPPADCPNASATAAATTTTTG